MQQNGLCQIMLCYYMIITDVLLHKQHFNIASGRDGANLNYFTHICIFVYKIIIFFACQIESAK